MPAWAASYVALGILPVLVRDWIGRRGKQAEGATPAGRIADEINNAGAVGQNCGRA
jgi:hypothetical protein